MWRRMVWSITDVSERNLSAPLSKNIYETTRSHMTEDRNLKSYLHILASRVAQFQAGPKYISIVTGY